QSRSHLPGKPDEDVRLLERWQLGPGADPQVHENGGRPDGGSMVSELIPEVVRRRGWGSQPGPVHQSASGQLLQGVIQPVQRQPPGCGGDGTGIVYLCDHLEPGPGRGWNDAGGGLWLAGGWQWSRSIHV